MNKLLLTIVTQNQVQQQAAALAAKLQSTLNHHCSIDGISKYTKFENSFKIELSIMLSETDIAETNHLAISLTSKIATPWLVYYDDTENIIELIFNRDANSQIGRLEFAEIRWAHVQIVP